jgi:hypothetical protein
MVPLLKPWDVLPPSTEWKEKRHVDKRGSSAITCSGVNNRVAHLPLS